MWIFIYLCLFFLSGISSLKTKVCNENMDCLLKFTMPTNISIRTCHCSRGGFLAQNPRLPITSLNKNCYVKFLTVLPRDSGVWQCQSPETRDKSEKIKMKVVGSLGSPTIEDNRGMLYLKKETCPSFTCAATIGLKTDTYLTWMNKKTGSEIVDYLSLNNSQTSLSPTSLSRTSSIQMCVLGDMDLVCKISSDAGKFRISLPLR